jgi:hypothetical protein
MKRVDYVRVYLPGTFVSDDTHIAVIGPDGLPAKWPDRAYGFSREWRYEGEGPDGKPVRGDLHGVGGKVIVGNAFTLEEARGTLWATSTLLLNMESNGWKRVVRCAQGCLPLYPDDVVVPELPRST